MTMPVEERVAIMESDMKEIKTEVKEISKQGNINAEKLVTLEQTIERVSESMKGQSKSHYDTLNGKLDDILKTTRPVTMIEDKPAEFYEKWSFLTKLKNSAEDSSSTIRNTIIEKLITAILILIGIGILTYLGKYHV
jgi:septation ring formation regulator EzrA